jgi:hypothetical protein
MQCLGHACPKAKEKSAFFVQSKEENLVNQIIQEAGPEEEGHVSKNKISNRH